MSLMPWKLRGFTERPKEGDMKVPSGLWEERQKMWLPDFGRDNSRGQLAEEGMWREGGFTDSWGTQTQDWRVSLVVGQRKRTMVGGS